MYFLLFNKVTVITNIMIIMFSCCFRWRRRRRWWWWCAALVTCCSALGDCFSSTSSMDYTWRRWGLLSFLRLESALPVCLTLTQWRCLADYRLRAATHWCRCLSFGRSIADNADLLTFTTVSYHHRNRRITDWKYGQCGLNLNSAKFAQETVDSEIRHE